MRLYFDTKFNLVSVLSTVCVSSVPWTVPVCFSYMGRSGCFQYHRQLQSISLFKIGSISFSTTDSSWLFHYSRQGQLKRVSICRHFSWFQNHGQHRSVSVKWAVLVGFSTIGQLSSVFSSSWWVRSFQYIWTAQTHVGIFDESGRFQHHGQLYVSCWPVESPLPRSRP